MENTLNAIRAIAALPGDKFRKLIDLLEPITVQKQTLLVKSGKKDPYLYFIEKGVARAFCETDEEEVTIWFGEEGDHMFSYNTYVKNLPGYESIELLEDSLLYRISITELDRLYTFDLDFSNWGRKLAERELIRTEERLIFRQIVNATKRYELLMSQQPGLLLRAPLVFIASYLGITPVSLSRIRGKRSS